MCVATKDGLPTSMQDEIEDKDKDYHSFPHKEWCDLLSTMEAKDNRKRTTDQIKILAASKAVPANYFSNVSAKVTLKNKASTCAIHTRKQQGKKNPNHKGSQRYCVLCKKTGMPERKYKLYSSENCFGCRSDHKSIKEGLVGILINRNNAVKQYQKSENKWKREMKPLKKQKKCYLVRPGAPVHVVNRRRSIRSAPRNPRNTSPLAVVALAVIMIPPSLVILSEMK